MKKILLAAGTAATILCVAGMAGDQGFVGAEVKYHGIDAQEPITGDGFNESAAALGIKAGGVNDKFRFYIMYDFIADRDHKDATISQYLFTGTVDWFIPFDTEKVKPYVGAILGYADYEFNSKDDSGIAYGAEAGLNIPLGDHIDADGFVRWIGADIDRLNYYLQAGVGINYRF